MALLKRLRNKFLGRKDLSSNLGSLGRGAEIDPSVTFGFPKRIRIGNYVHIEPRVFCEGKGGIAIHDHVIIAPEAVILSSMHRYKDATMVPYDQVDVLKPVTIGRCVWIGMRAMILPGVMLGEGCIVGAGAIVTKSFPEGSILGGNPAQIIGQRDMGQYFELVKQRQFYLAQKQIKKFSKIEVMVARQNSF